MQLKSFIFYVLKVFGKTQILLIFLSILCVCLSVGLSVCLSVCLSVRLSLQRLLGLEILTFSPLLFIFIILF